MSASRETVGLGELAVLGVVRDCCAAPMRLALLALPMHLTLAHAPHPPRLGADLLGDISPEEVRWANMQAAAAGTLCSAARPCSWRAGVSMVAQLQLRYCGSDSLLLLLPPVAAAAAAGHSRCCADLCPPRPTLLPRLQILFVINKPDVYKSPSSDTYVIFGEVRWQ